MSAKKDYNVLMFSGGKDSTALLIFMIKNNITINEVVNCDTGVEFDEMYNHIEKVKKHFDIEITTLKAEKSFEEYLLHHEKTKRNEKGEKGYSFPDYRNRWCTGILKLQPVRKYLKKLKKEYNVIKFVGIAANEIKRKKDKKNERYLLVEHNITEKDSLQMCYDEGFDFEGLYEKFARASCWCCPLQRIDELRMLRKGYPKKWEKLKEWESKTYRKFRPDYTIAELDKRFDLEKKFLENELSIRNKHFFTTLKNELKDRN